MKNRERRAPSMPEELRVTPLANSVPDEPSLAEQADRLSSRANVLAASVQAQLSVARVFPAGSREYSHVMDIVQNLKAEHIELRIEAAETRLLASLSGDREKFAEVLEGINQQVELQVSQARAVSQNVPPPPQDVHLHSAIPGPSDSGTEIAGEFPESDSEN
jgi:hypothetical protein